MNHEVGNVFINRRPAEDLTMVIKALIIDKKNNRVTCIYVTFDGNSGIYVHNSDSFDPCGWMLM